MDNYLQYLAIFICVLFLSFLTQKTVSSDVLKIIECNGVVRKNDKVSVTKWKLLEKKTNYELVVFIDGTNRKASFKMYKANGGMIFGNGGWRDQSGERSSLSIRYSPGIKIFKLDSRYTDLRIEGKCKGSII